MLPPTRIIQITCNSFTNNATQITPSSKLLHVGLHVPANRAAQRTLITVRLVIHLQRAFILTLALGELIAGVLRNVISITLSLVARIAEVSVPPTAYHHPNTSKTTPRYYNKTYTYNR